MSVQPPPVIETESATIPLKKLPGPRGVPIFGNARQIVPDRMHAQLESWSRDFGEFYKIMLGSRMVLVCANPHDIASVLKDRPSRFRRTARLEMVSRELNVMGLFASNGDDWRRQRTLVMQAFNPAHVRSYYPSLHTVTTRFLKKWRAHADANVQFELTPDLVRFTVDVIAGLAFGTDINTVESKGAVIQHHLNGVFRMLQKRLFAPFPYWHWIKFADDRALDKSATYIGEAIQEFIRLARLRMNRNPALVEHPENLLEALIAARDDEQAPLSDADLAGNVLTILLAGEDTTAHTLAWTIDFLDKHPEVFSRARAEADQVIGCEDLPSRHEQLGEMAFIEACINESMRLRPVAPFIGAEANIDTTIGNVAVPKGTFVLLMSRVAATDARYFADPDEFRPDRWLGPASPENNRKVSIPFGSGPRLCPGRFMAMEEMKMLVSMLVRHFDIDGIETPDGKAVQEHLTFTMAPKGLRLRLRRRDAAFGY